MSYTTCYQYLQHDGFSCIDNSASDEFNSVLSNGRFTKCFFHFYNFVCLESHVKLNALQKQLEMQAEAIANLTSYLKQQLPQTN